MTRMKDSKNYHENECLLLCREAERVLPVSHRDWTKVAKKYVVEANERGWPLRDGHSLKRKFMGLVHVEKSVGEYYV